VSERSDYAQAEIDDVHRLELAFEHGAELTKDLAKKTMGIPERRFRAAVSELRRRSYPVVSFSEQASTYRKAVNVQELERFIDSELVTRAREIEQRIRALRERASSWRSEGPQQRLI
jgi:hypothetical protein